MMYCTIQINTLNFSKTAVMNMLTWYLEGFQEILMQLKRVSTMMYRNLIKMLSLMYNALKILEET